MPKMQLKSWMDSNLHLHSCYQKCTTDYRHLWFSNNPCNISFSFWPSNPHCLPRIWTFGFDIFWPFYLWSIWWWLPIRPELHELQPRINNQNLKKTSLKIFKHYKLKPSFSIFKDEKANRGGGQAPTLKFQQFDQVWSNLIKFDPIWSNLI